MDFKEVDVSKVCFVTSQFRNHLIETLKGPFMDVGVSHFETYLTWDRDYFSLNSTKMVNVLMNFLCFKIFAFKLIWYEKKIFLAYRYGTINWKHLVNKWNEKFGMLKCQNVLVSCSCSIKKMEWNHFDVDL